MKPQRLAACHSLVLNYELDKCMRVIEPPPASAFDLKRFHSPEYIQFLQRVSPMNAEQYEKYFHKFNIGEDWYVFLNVTYTIAANDVRLAPYSTVSSNSAHSTPAAASRERCA